MMPPRLNEERCERPHCSSTTTAHGGGYAATACLRLQVGVPLRLCVVALVEDSHGGAELDWGVVRAAQERVDVDRAA